MTTAQLIAYYVSLLIMQYGALGNATAEMANICGAIIQDQVIQAVQNAFDLKNAIGAQLTILATYRGLTRTVFGASPGNYWSFVPYSDFANSSHYIGWTTYAVWPPVPPNQWLTYTDEVSVPYTLTDNQLRRMIGLKAALDFWQGGLGDLDNILYAVFGVYVNVVDNLNMSMIYQHIATDPDPDQLFQVVVLANILPHPAGVAATIVEV